MSAPPWDVPDILTLRRVRWQLLHRDWSIVVPFTGRDGRCIACRDGAEPIIADNLGALMDELEALDELDEQLGGDAA